MIDLTKELQISNSYYQSQHCNAQWRSFLQVFIQEIYQTAGEQDACAFLRHMGERLAHLYPVALYDRIEDLENSMNTIFAGLNWGWVKIEVHDLSLVFYHGAFPLPSFEKPQVKNEAMLFSALLEGLYSTWMVALGGKPDIVVQTQKAEPGFAFELIYTKP